MQSRTPCDIWRRNNLATIILYKFLKKWSTRKSAARGVSSVEIGDLATFHSYLATPTLRPFRPGSRMFTGACLRLNNCAHHAKASPDRFQYPREGREGRGREEGTEERKGREGKGREGKERREGKGREGKGRAGQGRKERKGKERKGKERKGKERKGKERKGKERKGKERKGKEWKGKERKGKERKGKERKGKERKGKEREGKGREGKGRERTGRDRTGQDRKGKERKGKGRERGRARGRGGEGKGKGKGKGRKSRKGRKERKEGRKEGSYALEADRRNTIEAHARGRPKFQHAANTMQESIAYREYLFFDPNNFHVLIHREIFVCFLRPIDVFLIPVP